jgi:hypothetical protein
MKYLHEEKFIVNSNDNEGRKKYLENYDRIFGDKPEPEKVCTDCSADGELSCLCPDASPLRTGAGDAIECRVKMYANLIVPLEAQIGPVENPLPVYYAHPIWFYNTEREREDVAEIERLLGLSVLNPNAPEHETGYQTRKASTGRGMDYFLEDVLPGCSSCVIRADADGKISSGVVLEAQWFIERGLTTLELTDDGLVPANITPERVLTIEESRRRCGK